MFCLDKMLFKARFEVLKRKQKGCFCYDCLLRSAEKTFFFSACRGRGVCMLSESSTQTVARRSANAPFLRYLGRKGTLNRNAFLRGGTPRMLTCSVLPCVGRGLSYGIMKAGMRGRLAFCTFPDARESRICDGGGGRV